MAQIQKFQTGTGAGGIQPSKLKFKIDGNDFEKDEQFVKDQFEPMFNELVAAKKAKARDKDLWRNSFQQYLTQAKTGQYELQSSSGTVLDSNYTGAQNAEVGMNEDRTAQKTVVGELISPRKQNDSQRMAFINGMLGDRLVGAYNADTAAAKAKAEADAAKLKGDKRTAALDKLKNFGTGYGNVSYGKDFATSPELIMERWFDPKVGDASRIASQSTYYGDQFRTLFDSGLDEFKDDADLKAKFNGRGLDEVREQAKKFYDPTTGKFTTQAKVLKDFGNYANVLDTMALDNPFHDRNAWLKMQEARTNSTKTPEQIALEKAEAEASAARAATLPKPTGGGLFIRNGKTFMDKDGNQLANGFVNGTLYGNGNVYDGHYIANNSTGEQDYLNERSGVYVGGKMTDKGKYEDYYRGLEKTGKYGAYLKMLTQRRQDADSLYETNFGGDSKYQTAETIQDKDASDFILKDYKGKYTHAQNVTDNYVGLKDAAVAFVRDDASSNRFGKPNVKNVVRLKGRSGGLPRTFVGAIRPDSASGELKFYDEQGREVKDVSAKLKGVKWDPNATNNRAKLFRQNLYGGEVERQGPTSGRYNRAGMGSMMKEGGVIKHQMGGNLGGIEASSSTQKRHQQATVRDIMDSSSSQYNLSNLDKWELGALAGDLTGVMASMTGAGSAIAGGLGVASTATQFGVDIARDGLDWGDAGRLGVGLALDAASFVPGLGIASSSSKTLRTLGKAAKWLVPALTAAGVVNAAGIVGDLVSGKKGITELSVDDLRGLVNGIHGVMGTKRMLRQNLATENATVHSIKLKNGRNAPISEADATLIKNADDKVAAAKAAIAKNNPGMNAADIELAPTYKANLKFWKGGFRKATPDSNTDVLENTSGTRIKSLDDYQGDNFSDRFMRNSINRALNRSPKSMVSQYEADNNVNVLNRKQFGALGDYTRKGVSVIPKAPLANGALEGPKLLPAPSGKPEMGNFTTRIQQTSTRTTTPNDVTDPNAIVGLRDKGRVSDRMGRVREAKAVKAAERKSIKEKEATAEVKITQEKQAAKKERQAEISKQLDMFGTVRRPLSKGQLPPAEPFIGPKLNGISPLPARKAEGGILKAQGGVKVPFLPPVEPPMYDISRFLPKQSALPFIKSPYAPGMQPQMELPKFDVLNSERMSGGNPAIAPYKDPTSGSAKLKNGINRPTAGSSAFGKIGAALRNIDPNMLSELSRALWTRQQNSLIDTRVERPMVDAPMEVSTPVRGNILLKQGFDNQANNIVRASNSLPTSDAMLTTAAQMEANKNAGLLRAQGDAGNVEAIERSRAASIENDMRNSQARSAAANQNVQTNARATQAERGAQNEKNARMNQPIADFWKDQNYKSMVKAQQDKGIDTQIALQGKAGNFNLIQQPLQAKYSTNQQKMASGTLSQAEIDALNAENAQIEQQVNWLNNQYVTDSLLTRKNNSYATPTDWYTKGMPVKKEGGDIKVRIQNQKEAGLNSRAIVKQHADFIEDGLEDSSKQSLQTMKQIQELIKLALS